ncbi:MAG: tRNA1(Val) (adenine(37)-N6)-methyltransferase [Alphaproteobacteria bacterium]
MTDFLLNKQVKINQPSDAFRTGLDTVLLAMTAPKIKSGNVLDMGAGVGALGLCYYKRLNNDNVNITGIEKSEHFFEYYKQNISNNDFTDNFNPINDDILNVDLKKASYELVITNPPFEKDGAYKSGNDLKNIANIESTCTLKDWLQLCVDVTKPNGYVAIIHKMERLDEILHHLHPRIGNIRILPIVTMAGNNPKRVIVVGMKDSKSSLKMCEPLLLSDTKEQYTDFVNKVLYGEAEIDLYKK